MLRRMLFVLSLISSFAMVVLASKEEKHSGNNQLKRQLIFRFKSIDKKDGNVLGYHQMDIYTYSLSELLVEVSEKADEHSIESCSTYLIDGNIVKKIYKLVKDNKLSNYKKTLSTSTSDTVVEFSYYDSDKFVTVDSSNESETILNGLNLVGETIKQFVSEGKRFEE